MFIYGNMDGTADHADLTMSNATHYYRLLILLLHVYEWVCTHAYAVM